MITEVFGRFQIVAEASGVKSESTAKFWELQTSGLELEALISGTKHWVPKQALVFRYWVLGTGTKGGGTGTQLHVPVPRPGFCPKRGGLVILVRGITVISPHNIFGTSTAPPSMINKQPRHSTLWLVIEERKRERKE